MAAKKKWQRRSGTKIPRLQWRGGKLVFRAKIPADLRKAFGGEREFIRHLGVSDVEVARILVAAHSADFDQKCLSLRRQASNDVLEQAGVTRITREEQASLVREARRRQFVTELKQVTEREIDLICKTYVRRQLDTNMEYRLAQDVVALELTEEARRRTSSMARQCFASGDITPFVEIVCHEVEYCGFGVESAAHGFPRLAMAFIQAVIQVDQLLEARSRGGIFNPEQIAPLADTVLQEKRVDGTTLETLFDAWRKDVPDRPQKTVDSYRADLGLFEEFLRDRRKRFAEDISPDDWIAFVDHLKEVVRHPVTVRKKVGTIRTVFNIAAEKKLLRFGNPCHRVRVKVPKNRKKPRLPFSIDELNALFRSPIYVDGWRPRGRGGDAYFWMPLLACFSGAREEELGQLRVSDIVRVDGLGWMMRITDEAPDAKIKTESSRRNVPIHAQLKQCGLLGYVERQRAAGNEWLFPELTPSTYGKRTTSFSKVFKRYLKSAVSIDKKTHVFHSFRHGFKDACRDSGIDTAVHNALTGHTTPGVGAGYGGEGYPLEPLFDAIKRLQYRGLDLSHLHQQELQSSSAS